MTSNKSPVKSPKTVAHWGGYEIKDSPVGTVLVPNAADDSPSVIGRGWVSAMQDKKARILRPAVRWGWLRGDGGAARNDDAYVEVPWDEALDITASELARVRDLYGNQAIFGGSYGWASAGRFHHCHSQLRRFLNLAGGYVGQKDTYSHAAAEVLFPFITGLSNKQIEEGATSWPLIADHCTLMLAFGGVSGRTAQIASGGTWAHEVDSWVERAAQNGMQTVNISPLKSDYLPGANPMWLSIRPGTDVALMMALTYEIMAAGEHDQAFLDRYTTGSAEYQRYLKGDQDGVAKTADWAAQICDIAADDIRALARRLPKERVMISVAWGVQRADHGEQPIWAALALACFLGQIGLPGQGFGFGYGSTAPPGRPKRFISWPSVPQGRNPVSDQIPVSRVADMLLSPGAAYSYDGGQWIYPDIKLIYWGGGNPFHHHQDLNRLEKAWQLPETVIVQDHSWTATARRADIVLPATSALEREDLFLNRRDPNLILMQKVMEPMGDARSDHEIFKGLAARLGIEEAFTEGRDEAGWKAWLWAGCQEVAKEAGFDLPDYETFREIGHLTIPEEDQTRILFSDFIADPKANALPTPSGKIELYCQRIADLSLTDCPGHPVWLPPAEWLGAANTGQLHLVSNQPTARLHSQLDNGAESQSRKVQGREVCTLHPETAAQFGLQTGDVARLFNARGSCLAAVHCDAGMRPDVIVLPTGAWLDLQDTPHGRIDVHGNPNVLTIDKGTSGLAQGNIAHTTLVNVEKWTDPLPPIRVFEPPRMVARDEHPSDPQGDAA
ncbi:molybdopterin-dependent oxidoreductase [Cognatishimia maritima]|uniref:Biotin/methionine sulfoxide reductase n=1 Tax=Cognatishimia maritima TaxID=870908 RepID=A0A1M5USN6_9RHOB|nr:molybdopterin-dependent oxidoreductase [Cognatishimia maritima]SHH65991.1 biotin/methionine sulfoxide reductase [Cognatishimia maritima]